GPAADGHLSIAERVPSKTDARAERVEGGVITPSPAGNCALCWTVTVGRGEVLNLPVVAVEFLRNGAEFVSESQVQSQPRMDAIIVLRIEPKGAVLPAAGLGGRECASQCRHRTVNSLGQISESRKTDGASVVEMAILWDLELVDQ